MQKNVAIKSPDDLQRPYKEHFNMLCRLAFDLLGNEKVVFGDDDVKKYTSKKHWSTLGLLRETTYFSVQENITKSSYSFLHLSMQECLAAHHIAKEVETNFLKNQFWDSRYLNTGVMYVGLTKGKSPAFKNFLQGRSGSLSRQFRTDKTKIYDKVKRLHFFHCLLEAKNDELSEQLQVNKVLHENTIDLSDHVLQQKDIHTLSYFFSRSTNKHWEKLDLSNCYMSNGDLEKFSAFSDGKITNVSIDTIDVSHNNLSAYSANAIINLISCFKTRKAIIADNIIDTLAFKVLLLSCVAKVKEVVISSNGENSYFLINYKCSSIDENLLNQLQLSKQVYIWNSNDFAFDDSITNLIKNSTAINFYQENLSDEKITNAISKLEEICAETNKTITYVLQSAYKIFAYRAEFYQILQSLGNDSGFVTHCSTSSQFWKSVDAKQCNIGDENFTKLSQVFCSHNIEYLNKLDLSQCGLTSLSIPLLLKILKCCIIKILMISDNLVCFKTLCGAIMVEVTVEDKIRNFEMKVPLKLVNNEISSLFFVNCVYDDFIVSQDYDFVNSQLCFSNIKLNEENTESFLEFCRNNKLQVNVFEMNTTDDIINGVLAELKLLQDNSYLLSSKTKLIAYNAKLQQIMAAIDHNSTIVTLQLTECEISFSKLYPLGNLLSNTSQNWELINFSGCDIKDEGCLSLYECFSTNKSKVHIEVLNISSNDLSSYSVMTICKCYQFCVIKTLIISRNDIPVYNFNEILKTYLLAKKPFLNFMNEIPLIVYENKSTDEICNVYAFQSSDLGVLLSQTHEDNILYNLYHVQFDQSYSFDHIFSIYLTSFGIKVYKLLEGVMNEKISTMITELTKHRYIKNVESLEVDFSNVDITDESCKILCNSIFNEETSFTIIERLDFSSWQFSLSCASTIIESFQYCVIKHLLLPSSVALDEVTKTILKDSYAGNKICNFIEKIPLTVNIEIEVEDDKEDETFFKIIVNTYLQNYEIKNELFDHFEDVVINKMTASHTFILLDCLKRNDLNSILSVLYKKESYIKICIFEVTLTNDVLVASVNHLKTLRKGIYRDRLQYVLASDSNIIVHNVQDFYIIHALQIRHKICGLEVSCCSISVKTIALKLADTFDLLKNIKVTACEIKDKDFFGFCAILSAFSKQSIHLKTLDFSHNYLTSSCIGAILTLLQCCVIEKLIVSNNAINDSALTDAIFQLAHYKWDKFCNLNASIPLVVINVSSSQHLKSVADRGRFVTIFIMNCEIDKNLLQVYSSCAKKIYFLNSLVKFGDLSENLSMLYHAFPSIVKVTVYEKDLKDEVAQKAAMYLARKPQIHI